MAPQPNIVFVFADQLRYSDLACNGNRMVQTPSFDRLAGEGLCFDEAIASSPICSASRAQLLTGRYAHANGVIDNEYRFFPGQTSIADALRGAGYWTGYVGKLHLAHPPYGDGNRLGFDDFWAYNNMHSYYDVEYWHNDEGPFPMVGYAPRVETQLALDAIEERQHVAPDQPFALFLSWGPPHWGPRIGKKDYSEYPQQYNIYDPKQIDLPPNVPLQMELFAREEIADYYGMITSLDACMERILHALDEWDLTDNTIVVFTSDHGDHLSSHGYGKPFDAWMHHTLTASKATPFEESVHVPFLLRCPSQIAGNRRLPVSFSIVDVSPTLLGLCGVPVPEDMQGTDLSSAVRGEPGPRPDSVYMQILGPGWPTRRKWVGLWRGVRTDRYTYARWKDRGGMRVLFDRMEDPNEMRNLIDDPAYAGLAAEMEQRLQEWIDRTNDPFDTGERLPVTDMLDLKQVFSASHWYELAPEEYADAIRKYSPEQDSV